MPLPLALGVLTLAHFFDWASFLIMVGRHGLGAEQVRAVANEIFVALLKQKLTRDRLLEAVVVGFERSSSPDDARANGALVERGGPFPVALAQRLEAATRSNQHVASVGGLREQIQRVARAIGKQSL